MPRWLRARAPYLAVALITIALGLGIHGGGVVLGRATQDILGDALWAMMMAWWIGAVLPDRSPRMRAAVALAISFAVELSQLWHTPALDAIRATRGGHLVLGSGFDPRDFAAYTAGVLAAVVIELAVRRSRDAADDSAVPSPLPR